MNIKISLFVTKLHIYGIKNGLSQSNVLPNTLNIIIKRISKIINQI